jgi:hypothetical protein
MDIQLILDAISRGQVRITDHADEEAAADGLALDEIYASVQQGEVIEDYPRDKPLPSCLIYGSDSNDLPIHSVWAYNHNTGWAALVTVYRPDPKRWKNWRKRKK